MAPAPKNNIKKTSKYLKSKSSVIARKERVIAMKKAILPLQRMYRFKNAAKAARLEMGIVDDEAPSQYPFLLLGNEPEIRIPDTLKRIDTRFNLIATGGINALKIIKELIAWESFLYTPTMPIPKLFIMDFSDKAAPSWKFIKKLFANLPTYNDIEEPLNLERFIQYAPDAYDDLQNAQPIDICKQTVYLLNELIDKWDSEQYNFFREVVLGATILCNDWRDFHTHHSLSTHLHGQQNYVYSSNIIECIQRYYDQEYTIEENLEDNKDFVEDICKYNPLLTIYARTSIIKYNAINHKLCPDNHLFISGANPNVHLQELSQPHLSPINKVEYLEHLKKYPHIKARTNHTM